MHGDGKVTWVTMVTKDLTGRLHAGHLARDLAKLTGGGGGGRPDMAEAGGKDPARIPDALGEAGRPRARANERLIDGPVTDVLRGEYNVI